MSQKFILKDVKSSAPVVKRAGRTCTVPPVEGRQKLLLQDVKSSSRRTSKVPPLSQNGLEGPSEFLPSKPVNTCCRGTAKIPLVADPKNHPSRITYFKAPQNSTTRIPSQLPPVTSL